MAWPARMDNGRMVHNSYMLTRTLSRIKTPHFNKNDGQRTSPSKNSVISATDPRATRSLTFNQNSRHI